LQELRRCFDEWRALQEVYGWRQPRGLAELLRDLRGQLALARREHLPGETASLRERAQLIVAIAGHHLARTTGALLGSRAELIPPRARRWLSLERREGFAPLDLGARRER
jgi:hypothetical protein